MQLSPFLTLHGVSSFTYCCNHSRRTPPFSDLTLTDGFLRSSICFLLLHLRSIDAFLFPKTRFPAVVCFIITLFAFEYARFQAPSSPRMANIDEPAAQQEASGLANTFRRAGGRCRFLNGSPSEGWLACLFVRLRFSLCVAYRFRKSDLR